MAKITQEQLIESLKQLKEIKPNREWASLLKSQILAEQKTEPIQAQSASFINTLKAILAPRKLAYSFAAILFLIIGVFGFKNLPQRQIALVTPASQETKNQTEVAIKNQISATVKTLAQNFKNYPVHNSQTMKALAKTLADIPGDVTSSQDVKDMYQTVVESQIADLQKATLTDDQKNTLAQAEELSGQGKYADALEKILLINN